MHKLGNIFVYFTIIQANGVNSGSIGILRLIRFFQSSVSNGLLITAPSWFTIRKYDNNAFIELSNTKTS